MPYSGSLDSQAIAARIRGLLGGHEAGDLPSIAQRLGVREFVLRMCIDDLSPVPTLEVLAAIVNVYGVDPSWLLYGEYDSSTHRRAVSADRHVTPSNVLELASSHRADEERRPDLRLEA